MAWTIGNLQSGQSWPSAVTSETLTAPTGIANGHLLFAAVATDIAAGGDPGSISMANAGSGAAWTPLTDHFTPAGFHGSIRLATFWKIASGESGNYTASWATAAKSQWGIVDLSGNAASSPVDVSASSNNTSTSATSLVAPALTGLTGSADLLMCCWANPGGGTPYTMPSGMTTLITNGPNTDGTFLGMSYLVLSSSANTATQTVTASGGDPNETMSVAFLAAGGGGGGSITATGSDGTGRNGAIQSLILMRDRLFDVPRRILRPDFAF